MQPLRSVHADWYMAMTWGRAHFVPGDTPTRESGGRPVAATLCGDHLAYVDPDGRKMAELGDRCPQCRDALTVDPQKSVDDHVQAVRARLGAS
jgi:hypothetical protein